MLAATSAVWYVLGLGVLGSFPLRRSQGVGSQEGGMRVSVVLGCGLLLAYLLVLVCRSLALATVIGGGLAALGTALWVREHLRARRWPRVRLGWAGLVAVYVLVLLLVSLVTLPLQAGDARSIWFFHAKIIYYAQGLGTADMADVWGDDTLAFSHPDYPKLVAVLAAQLAYVHGAWNEYLPKAVLAGLLAVALSGAVARFRAALAACFFLLFCVLDAGELLWNGYMDGHLAVLGTLAGLALTRWLAVGSPGDLFHLLVCVGLVISLKNEGLVLAVCFALAAAVGSLRHPSRVRARRAAAYGAALALAPWLLWFLCRWQWGLSSDLFAPDLTARGWHRLLDAQAHRMIVDAFLHDGAIVTGGLALALAWLGCLWCRCLPRGSWAPLAVAALYAGALYAVYLTTPHDLGWHLDTSAARILLAVKGLVWLSAAMLLGALVQPVCQDSDRESALPPPARSFAPARRRAAVPPTPDARPRR